jgi:cytochrome c-type biogenesis protein CcmH
MGQFLFLALLLCLLACAFAVSALWQKSRALAVAIALLLTLAAGGLYWYKGSSAALDPANVQPPKTLDEAIVQLERLTSADPRNGSDQLALARGYMAKGRYAEAEAAYAKATTLLPGETGFAVEYAEAMLRNSPDRRFPPAAVAILESALRADPQNQRALFFLGLHQRQSGQNAEAVSTWERLLRQLDAVAAPALREQIAQARAAAGMPPLAEPEARLQVRVELDPTLAREAGPGTVLYVFARAAAGGPPVAVKRLQPASWPVTLGLGDEDSPMPTAKLSEQTSVQLVARVSRSGDAKAQSGDLESEPVEVLARAGTSATLRIDRTVP